MTNVSRDEMRELAERCEKATGPDRDLDAEIDKAIHPDDWTDGLWFDPSRHDLPAYTASLDAAMSLVPEGMLWLAGYAVDGRAIATVDFDHQRAAATPALALCAAALRARATKESKDATG
jgi:hypothetical protein